MTREWIELGKKRYIIGNNTAKGENWGRQHSLKVEPQELAILAPISLLPPLPLPHLPYYIPLQLHSPSTLNCHHAVLSGASVHFAPEMALPLMSPPVSPCKVWNTPVPIVLPNTPSSVRTHFGCKWQKHSNSLLFMVLTLNYLCYYYSLYMFNVSQ